MAIVASVLERGEIIPVTLRTGRVDSKPGSFVLTSRSVEPEENLDMLVRDLTGGGLLQFDDVVGADSCTCSSRFVKVTARSLSEAVLKLNWRSFWPSILRTSPWNRKAL